MKHSYMIIDKVTNEVVLEVWDCSLPLKERYYYKTAMQYLCELNKIAQINKM